MLMEMPVIVLFYRAEAEMSKRLEIEGKWKADF